MDAAQRQQFEDAHTQPLADKTKREVMQLCGLEIPGEYHHIRLLNFGAGAGKYLECFATYLPQENVFGVEFDDALASRARHRGLSCLSLDTEQAKLPFDSDYFDIIFSSGAIEHIPRPVYLQYLKEIHRVLRPAGKFVVGTPNYPFKRLYDFRKAIKTGNYRQYFFDDPSHCNKLSVSRLEADLRPYFSSVSMQPTYLMMERKLPPLKWPDVRRRLRLFGDKMVGVCINK